MEPSPAQPRRPGSVINVGWILIRLHVSAAPAGSGLRPVPLRPGLLAKAGLPRPEREEREPAGQRG